MREIQIQTLDNGHQTYKLDDIWRDTDKDSRHGPLRTDTLGDIMRDMAKDARHWTIRTDTLGNIIGDTGTYSK